MCILKLDSTRCKMINRSKLGRAVQGVLTCAQKESRLICGLRPAISFLEKISDSEDVLLCVLPQTRPGDAATHMQTVLLQAFCYENDIPVIQVDSSEKLAEYCGISSDRKLSKAECFCALITRDLNNNNNTLKPEDPPLSPSERVLTEFYECTLEEFPRPIIELPI